MSVLFATSLGFEICLVSNVWIERFSLAIFVFVFIRKPKYKPSCFGVNGDFAS